MRILRWGLRALLALIFLAAGAMKLAGNADAVATFERLGIGPWFRILVGLCEFAGGIGLLVSPVAPLSALALAGLMAGAIASYLLVLGTSNMTPAVIAFALCFAVVWLERGSLKAFRVLRTGKGPMDGWMARAYDRGVQTAFRDVFQDLSREFLADSRNVRRILDAGCGPGQFTIVVAEQVRAAEVWGIDLAPAMIALARHHAARSSAASRVHFEVADVSRLPFPEGHFDLVMSSGSLKHWGDPLAGLRELHRVLAPGGRALVSEMNRLAPPEAVAAAAARSANWFARRMYSHALGMSLSTEEGRALFASSPFGRAVRERMLLDGCICLFELRKAA